MRNMEEEEERYFFPIIMLGFRLLWQESESLHDYRIMN